MFHHVHNILLDCSGLILSTTSILIIQFIKFRNDLYTNIHEKKKQKYLLSNILDSNNQNDSTSDDIVIKWCDQSSFEVLTSLCDSFIPNIESLICTPELILQSIHTIHPVLTNDNMIFSNTDVLKENMDYLCRGALDLDIHIVITKTIQILVSSSDQLQFYLMLKLLNTSLGTFLLFGYPIAYPNLSLANRVMILTMMRDSSIIPIRVFYQTIKRLTGNLYFSYIRHQVGDSNINWNTLQYYPNETRQKQYKKEINQHIESFKDCQNDNKTENKTENENPTKYLHDKIRYESVKTKLINEAKSSDDHDVLEADVVIIGSGAGGGMMASELAKAGLNVLVLEKGGYYRKEEFQEWNESTAMLHAYEKGGLCISKEGNVLILAGSCVGGGTTVNWSASFRTPDWVRDEWVHKYGLSQFSTEGEFETSLNAVHQLLNVNTNNSYYDDEEEDVETNDKHFVVNGNNQILWKGALKLGYKPERIPRNVRHCVDCGSCCHGCPYESKQSTLTALLEPLLLSNLKKQQQHQSLSSLSNNNDNDNNNDVSNKDDLSDDYQLHIIPYTYVNRILYEDYHDSTTTSSSSIDVHPCTKRAIGVEATVRVIKHNPASLTTSQRIHQVEKTMYTTRRIRVNAKLVVSAAGTLHTPALLLRSQIHHMSVGGIDQGKELIGAYLTLHPVLGTGAYFPSNVKTGLASGVSMGVVVREPIIAIPSRPTHRIAIQTPPIHIGLMGTVSPWQGKLPHSLAYKIAMLGWVNAACFIGISRDISCVSNCITIDNDGQPVIHYELIPEDKELLLLGLEHNLRIMRAAGAQLIYASHENFPYHDCTTNTSTTTTSASIDTKDDKEVDDEAQRFESYIQSVYKEGISTARMQVVSAHQMGTCRMASHPYYGPTSPTGELYSCKDLYIADGSIFPTSLGINPMITIEAISHMISKNIIKKLCDNHPEIKEKIKKFQNLKNRNSCIW